MGLLIVHVAAALFMTGLIWFVQVVHYPLMARVGQAAFAAYETEHMRRTGWVVGPAMLTEAVTAVGLVAMPAPWISRPIMIASLVLLAGVWASTALVQIPLHKRLAQQLDPWLVRRLVASNWLRTVAWSLRSGLVIAAVIVPMK